MVHLDSDILGILLALLTFIVPVITSIKEGKQKKKNKLQRELEIGSEFEYEYDLQEELVEDKMAGEEAIEEKVVEEELPTVKELFVEGTRAVEQPQPVEENVISDSFLEESEDSTPSVKEKLRSNPKDALILGEILKPKFKEY